LLPSTRRIARRGTAFPKIILQIDQVTEIDDAVTIHVSRLRRDARVSAPKEIFGQVDHVAKIDYSICVAVAVKDRRGVPVAMANLIVGACRYPGGYPDWRRLASGTDLNLETIRFRRSSEFIQNARDQNILVRGEFRDIDGFCSEYSFRRFHLRRGLRRLRLLLGLSR
jgi:hypothetical protein